jgi:hypothetical protein
MTAETRRRWLRVMIAVPVFTPGGYLQRAEPPDILAGVDTFRKAGFEMQKTVDEALHVQAIEHSDRTEPKETGPAKHEITEAE